MLYQINISTQHLLGECGIGRREDEKERGGVKRGMDIPGSKNTDERAYYWQSYPLWARQREGKKERDNAWKRESQSEREASKPLKKTLRFTPSRPPPHTQYSPSLSQSRWISLVSCDVLFDFAVFVRKMPFFDSPTVRALMDQVGKLIKRSFNFWHEKVRLTWHIQIPLELRSPFMNLYMISFSIIA